MRGFEGFFSPLDPRPVYTVPAARRPWDGVEEEKKSSSERDPDRSPPSSSSSSSAGAPSSELPSQHPELAPPSTSSIGSIPSPVREVTSKKMHDSHTTQPRSIIVLGTWNSPSVTQISSAACFNISLLCPQSNRPENNRDLRQRLIGRANTAQAQAPALAPRRGYGYDDQRERRWPASRVLLCRICAW